MVLSWTINTQDEEWTIFFILIPAGHIYSNQSNIVSCILGQIWVSLLGSKHDLKFEVYSLFLSVVWMKVSMIACNGNVKWSGLLTGINPLKLCCLISWSNEHHNTLNNCFPCVQMHWAHYTWVCDIKWPMDPSKVVPWYKCTVMCFNEPGSDIHMVITIFYCSTLTSCWHLQFWVKYIKYVYEILLTLNCNNFDELMIFNPIPP